MDELIRTVGPSGDPSKDTAFLEQAEKDILKFSSAPRTREEMDELFGIGQWRPMRRFVLWQSQHNKWRAIDDGHASGHNGAISNIVRVHTTDPPGLLRLRDNSERGMLNCNPSRELSLPSRPFTADATTKSPHIAGRVLGKRINASTLLLTGIVSVGG